VEGWFVDADARREGIGRLLLLEAERWAAAAGCREMASDTQPANHLSLAAHRALGFEESSRAVHLRKGLASTDRQSAEEGQHKDAYELVLIEGTFAVCRLEARACQPAWASAGNFVSVTRTSDELSVVCDSNAVPEGIRCERGWRCLRIRGSIPFSAVGVLARLTGPLADAGVSVFSVSTHDTDYLLIREENLSTTVATLGRHGFRVLAT
jgi:hypothetical protein